MLIVINKKHNKYGRFLHFYTSFFRVFVSKRNFVRWTRRTTRNFYISHVYFSSDLYGDGTDVWYHGVKDILRYSVIFCPVLCTHCDGLFWRRYHPSDQKNQTTKVYLWNVLWTGLTQSIFLFFSIKKKSQKINNWDRVPIKVGGMKNKLTTFMYTIKF